MKPAEAPVQHQLPADVAAKYECANPTVIHTPWGERQDLRTITLEDADRLFARGETSLTLRKQPAKAAAPTGEK